MLGRAEEQRVKLTGACDEQPFDDLRDVDELTSSFFEVLTSTGKYYWIPLERVESVEFCWRHGSIGPHRYGRHENESRQFTPQAAVQTTRRGCGAHRSRTLLAPTRAGATYSRRTGS